MPWNDADTATLTSLWNDGVDSRAIAAIVGKPRHAVLRQVIALGLSKVGRPRAASA